MENHERLVRVQLPFYTDICEIILTEKDQRVAWEFFLEFESLVIRHKEVFNSIILREEFHKLYSLFSKTRGILKECEPSVAEPIGILVINFLNRILRPFLSEWHPRLKTYEDKKSSQMSIFEYERNWAEFDKLLEEFRHLQMSLLSFCDALKIISKQH